MGRLRMLRSAGWASALLAAMTLTVGGAGAVAAGRVPPAAVVEPVEPSGSSGAEAPGDTASPIRHTMPAADVLIDAGHGGIDSGTLWSDVLEKDINLSISRKLYLILRSRGVQAVLNRTGDYALSDDNRWLRASRHNRDLSQRGGLAGEIEPKMFVSIHVNWSPRNGRKGPIVLHQNEAHSALLASFIQHGLNRQQKANQLPYVGGQYYVLKRVRVPSVIVETAFLSNPGDRAMLTSPRGQTLIAAAIAEGILTYRCLFP